MTGHLNVNITDLRSEIANATLIADLVKVISEYISVYILTCKLQQRLMSPFKILKMLHKESSIAPKEPFP